MRSNPQTNCFSKSSNFRVLGIPQKDEQIRLLKDEQIRLLKDEQLLLYTKGELNMDKVIKIKSGQDTRIKCPHCRDEITVKSEDIGHTLICPLCWGLLVVLSENKEN